METTSKIKSVSSRFSEKSNKRYYDIVMENGDTGTIGHNNENAYQVGKELKYKLTLKKDSTDKYWMNEVREKKRGGSQQRDYKIDFIIESLKIANDCELTDPENICKRAEAYYNRMEKKYLSVKQQNNG